MKKILVITYYWPPKGGVGVQRWLKLTKYLCKYNYEPIIYTPEDGFSPLEDQSLVDTISPKLTFLPGSQSNQYGKGDFYGNNYGIGFGMTYKPLDRLKTFSSYYVPLGDSSNSFDYQLNYSKASIYTLGLNYLVDSRTNFEAFLSNGFGLSPATSVLTIPSSDEILYG